MYARGSRIIIRTMYVRDSMERIKDIKESYEFRNFTIEELQKIKLIKEIMLLERQLKCGMI
jgi:hypothetical protein